MVKKYKVSGHCIVGVESTFVDNGSHLEEQAREALEEELRAYAVNEGSVDLDVFEIDNIEAI